LYQNIPYDCWAEEVFYILYSFTIHIALIYCDYIAS